MGIADIGDRGRRIEAKIHVLAKIIATILGVERLSEIDFDEREKVLLRSMLEDEYPGNYEPDLWKNILPSKRK